MGNKNYHSVERLPHQAVKALVWGIIGQEKALSKLQVCRKLNGNDVTDCKYARTCYANSRKRAEYGKIFVADCKISFMQIRYAIKKLVAEGLVHVKRQRWPDHWQNRGWDNMWICRPVIGGL
ncbi:MAG: hypothetical protein ACYS76_04490 [Planctomycetota bacterium]